MKHLKETKQMKRFVTKALARTKEFSDIYFNPEFEERTSLDEALNTFSDRQLLAIKKPEFVREGESEKYLIILDADLMEIKEVGMKLAAASLNNINTTHILHWFSDSEGPFFNHKVQIQKHHQEIDEYLCHRDSLQHIDFFTRERIINATEMEREILKALSNNQNAAYKPKENLIPEKLHLIKYDLIEAKYGKQTQELKKYLLPNTITKGELFTLVPSSATFLEDQAAYLTNAMREKYDLAGVIGNNKIRTAKPLIIPDITCRTEEQVRIRYNLAMIEEQMIRHPTIQQIQFLKRAHEQLNDINNRTVFYQKIKEEYQKSDLGFLFDKELSMSNQFPITYYAKHASKSLPGVRHTTKIYMASEDPKDWKYECRPCKGHQIKGKCWHVDQMQETIETLVK